MMHSGTKVSRHQAVRTLLRILVLQAAVMLLFFPGAWADESAPVSGDRSFLIVPAGFYTSDTGFGFGGGGLFSYRIGDATDSRAARLSSLAFFGLTTTRHQSSLAVQWDHYFNHDRNRLYVKLNYEKYPTDFFGMGNTTSSTSPERYTPEFVEGTFFLEQQLVGKLHVRGTFLFRKQSLLKHEPGGSIISPVVPWGTGRFDAGPGIGIVWDSRDNTASTRSGTFVSLNFYGMLLQDSGHSANRFVLDLRHFRELMPGITGATLFRFEDIRGDVPFYLMPSLGGQDVLRGHESHRFIGRSMAVAQQELRFPIWKRLGGAVFCGAGRVAPHAGDLAGGRWHAAGGGGLRYFFNMEDRLAVRFDAGWGDGSRGTYIVIGEAF